MTYMQFNELNQNYKNSIMLWLLALTVMVFLIIIIGGLTRLTDSGLSITEWELFKGILPPLNIEKWNFPSRRTCQTCSGCHRIRC